MSAPLEPSSPTPTTEPRRWLRPLLVVLLLLTTLALSHFTGLAERFDVEAIRANVERAGSLGYLLFVALFALGLLVQIPGLVFVAAAMVVFEPVPGIVVSFVGAVTAASMVFLVVRALGGRPLAGLERPLLKKLLARLDSRPILVIALLRLLFWQAPILNYTLAMTSVRFVDFMLGTALGLLLPVGGAAVAIAWLLP